MGPQNQVGIHETTNLFMTKPQSQTLVLAAVNADIVHVNKALFELSLIVIILFC